MTNPYIFSPLDIADLSTKDISRRVEAHRAGGLARGLPMYIKSLDMHNSTENNKMLPITGGNMLTVTARPGHGKTALMFRLARTRSKEISASQEKDAPLRVSIYVTYEQTVEALNAFHVAASSREKKISITSMALGDLDDEQLASVKRLNMLRAADPLWFIGHSSSRAGKRPKLTTEVLAEALYDIKKWHGGEGYILDSLFIDYLQLLPFEGRNGKAEGVSNNLVDIKNIALEFNVPTVLGVQARRECDDRDDPLPQARDGEWSAGIEQYSDFQLALIRPCRYAKLANEPYHENIVKGIDQMLIAVHKQKEAIAPFATWVQFNPAYNQFNDYEVKQYKLNGGE